MKKYILALALLLVACNTSSQNADAPQKTVGTYIGKLAGDNSSSLVYYRDHLKNATCYIVLKGGIQNGAAAISCVK